MGRAPGGDGRRPRRRDARRHGAPARRAVHGAPRSRLPPHRDRGALCARAPSAATRDPRPGPAAAVLARLSGVLPAGLARGRPSPRWSAAYDRRRRRQPRRRVNRAFLPRRVSRRRRRDTDLADESPLPVQCRRIGLDEPRRRAFWLRAWADAAARGGLRRRRARARAAGLAPTPRRRCRRDRQRRRSQPLRPGSRRTREGPRAAGHRRRRSRRALRRRRLGAQGIALRDRGRRGGRGLAARRRRRGRRGALSRARPRRRRRGSRGFRWPHRAAGGLLRER